MAGDEGLGWRAQLGKVRERVEELEKRREVERRLERERNEQALSKRLKDDTPEALAARFQELQKRFDRDARRLYPLPQLEEVGQELSDFADLLRFYEDCAKSFPKVFTPQHKTTVPSLLRDITELQRGLDRQLGQWREVKAAADAVSFRPRTPEDDAALAAVARTFSERAHRVTLDIRSDYFTHEKENFWVIVADGAVVGFVKYASADKVINFAMAPAEKVNFTKFIRASLAKFCTEGPLPEPLPAVRVHIVFLRETKFFTDMGFVRAETKGPSEWIYQRNLA